MREIVAVRGLSARHEICPGEVRLESLLIGLTDSHQDKPAVAEVRANRLGQSVEVLECVNPLLSSDVQEISSRAASSACSFCGCSANANPAQWCMRMRLLAGYDIRTIFWQERPEAAQLRGTCNK